LDEATTLETWLTNLTFEPWQKFTLAVLMGLLVGLEREHSQQERETAHFAGIRTFPLIALLGCTAAMLSVEGQVWLFAVGFAGLAALVVTVYTFSARQGNLGLTTEVVVLLVYLIGGLIYWDQLWLAVALGVIVTALLALRPTLHGLVARIEREDIYAALKLGVVSAVVLPLLPDQMYGPLEVLNPFRIWLMVVFVSAVSFSGYVAIKLLGPRKGVGLTGLLGGLISSTAVTLSFSQRSRDAPSLGQYLALGIALASTTMYPIIILQVLAFNGILAERIWLPMVLLAGLGAGGCIVLWRTASSKEAQVTHFANPFRLWPAIQFGLLFGVVLLVTKGAQVALGDAGVYVASFLAGLTGLDAITLSMAQLAGKEVTYGVATQALLLAATANTLAKGGLVLALGAPALRRSTLPVLGLMSLASLGLAIWMS
jgi:uncharacterized membrane protein (DUF4010 family)